MDDEEQALVAQLIRAGKTKNEAQQQAVQAKEVQVKALGMELNLIEYRLIAYLKKYFTSCDPHHDMYTFSYWQILRHSI